VEVTMKKLKKKQLENSGIFILFEKTTLAVGKTTLLTIVWQPTSAKYIEKSTKEQHLIYLEVKLIFIFIRENSKKLYTRFNAMFIIL